MTVRPIRTFGDPLLRTTCRPVTEFDRELRRLVADLTETLDDADGAGLAAPQIGVDLRVFVYVDADPDSANVGEIRHIVNPVLIESSAETLSDIEGCLSLPGLELELARAQHVVAEGVDAHGELVRVVGSDRLARCLAHETDHLDGVLFIDRLAPDERRRALALVRELQLAGENVVVKRSPHAGLG